MGNNEVSVNRPKNLVLNGKTDELKSSRLESPSPRPGALTQKNEGAPMRSFKLPANNLCNGVRGLLNPSRRINLLSLLLSAMVLGGASFAVAQTVNSRVSGVVKDSAGASVPGAKVTLTDTATKEQKKASTSEDGSFTISDVRPGTYSVGVEATGFKKLSVTNLTVHVDTPVILN